MVGTSFVNLLDGNINESNASTSHRMHYLTGPWIPLPCYTSISSATDLTGESLQENA